MDFSKVIKLRCSCAMQMRDLLPQFVGRTELDLAEALNKALFSDSALCSTGWYSPPPNGIAVLSARPNAFARLNFDSLRRQDYWPGSNQIKEDSVVVLYASPVLKESLLIGDWGGTIYLGRNASIANHIAKCERVMRDLAYSFHSGSSFSEIHHLAQRRFKAEGLNNASTVSDSDPGRTNLGHTVPFSFAYEPPSGFDAKTDDFRVKISTARRFLSASEALQVPRNGILTFESRLVDENDSSLPNTLVHLMLVVRDGVVEVC